MTRTKKMTARHETSTEESQPQKTRAQATDDELKRQMQSALEDVYEVLLIADGSETEQGWAGIKFVNDLTHYLRRPDRIVVDRTAGGDRVVVMNNREYGLTDNVAFSPDEPTAGDKKYLVSRFLELYYGNNPDIRDHQLNEAIQLMVASRG